MMGQTQTGLEISISFFFSGKLKQREKLLFFLPFLFLSTFSWQEMLVTLQAPALSAIAAPASPFNLYGTNTHVKLVTLRSRTRSSMDMDMFIRFLGPDDYIYLCLEE
jgi:hypothetical protein